MPLMQNPLDHPAFKATKMTEAINKVPNRYGRLNELGVAPVVGVETTTVTVYEQGGVLTLLPTTQRGAPPTLASRAKAKSYTFKVPHIPHNDFISPDDIQNLIAFARGNGRVALQSLAAFLNNRLEELRAKHDQTLEWHRMGMIKGKVLDADGATELFDFYDAFGITQKSVDFALGTAGTDIKAKCLEVLRHIEDHLMGEVMTGTPRVLVDPELFDKLTSHAKVTKAFENWQAAAERLGGDMRRGFPFAGLLFEEYRAETMGSDGNVKSYIAPGEGHVIPLGTAQTFRTYAAPSDFNEDVNQLGRLYYAKTAPAEFDRGWKIHTQSNPLAICLRPGILVRVHTSD